MKKTDPISSFVKFFDHDRYKALAVIATASIGVYLGACQSTAPSLVDKNKSVGIDMLEAEYTSEQAKLEAERDTFAAQWNSRVKALDASLAASTAEIERKEAMKAKFVEFVGGVGQLATSGTLNLSSIVGSLVTLGTGTLAVGSILDGRRKDKKIKETKGQA